VCPSYTLIHVRTNFYSLVPHSIHTHTHTRTRTHTHTHTQAHTHTHTDQLSRSFKIAPNGKWSEGHSELGRPPKPLQARCQTHSSDSVFSIGQERCKEVQRGAGRQKRCRETKEVQKSFWFWPRKVQRGAKEAKRGQERCREVQRGKRGADEFLVLAKRGAERCKGGTERPREVQRGAERCKRGAREVRERYCPREVQTSQASPTYFPAGIAIGTVQVLLAV